MACWSCCNYELNYSPIHYDANIPFFYRETLCEDEAFSERELAALVASKVYYQLGEYNESMTFALSAGKLFDLDNPGEYEDTIIGMNLCL
jgi:hypothetical protein